METRIHHVSVAITSLAFLVLCTPVAAQSVCAVSAVGLPLELRAFRAAVSGAPQSRYDGHLGVMFSAHVDAEGRGVTRIDGDGLTVVKTMTAFGEAEILVSFKKDRVVFALGPDGISVRRGTEQAKLNPKSLTEADLARAERVIRGSQAIRAFKQLTAQIEFTEGPDDFFTLGALVDGALVRILDGEVGVVHRLGNRLEARQRARVRQASFAAVTPQFQDCVGMWEATLMYNWKTFTGCVDDAGDAAWYLRTPLAAGCEIEWVLRSQAASFQFFSCAAIPLK